MPSLVHSLALSLLLTLILATPPLIAQDQTRNEFWPEIDVYYRINPTYRLFLLVSPALSRDNSANEVQVAGHVEAGLFPIFRSRWAQTHDVDRFRFLRLKLGAGYSSSLPSSERSSSEWRGIVELTGRASLPLDILGSLRNRLDLRWLDDGFSARYRARLKLERDMEITDGWSIVPFASAEPFYDSRFKAWSRVQYEIGITFPIVPMFAFEVYYLRQNNWHSQPARVNALGLVAIGYF